jgi:hypothetical protein
VSKKIIDSFQIFSIILIACSGFKSSFTVGFHDIFATVLYLKVLLTLSHQFSIVFRVIV